jgi:hypothetical protein
VRHIADKQLLLSLGELLTRKVCDRHDRHRLCTQVWFWPLANTLQNLVVPTHPIRDVVRFRIVLLIQCSHGTTH